MHLNITQTYDKQTYTGPQLLPRYHGVVWVKVAVQSPLPASFGTTPSAHLPNSVSHFQYSHHVFRSS